MKNFLLDAILFALFLAELSFHFLPKILHEIFGVIFIVLIIFHVAINFRRVLLLTKNLTPRKLFAMEVNVALIMIAALILATGVCMSNYLFPDAANQFLRRNMTIHQLHVSAPYVMMILIGMHLGLHWREFWQRFLNLVGLEEFYQRRKIIFKAAAGILADFFESIGDADCDETHFRDARNRFAGRDFYFVDDWRRGIFRGSDFFCRQEIFSLRRLRVGRKNCKGNAFGLGDGRRIGSSRRI